MTLVLHYNDLVFLRQRARRNWSNVGVSLRKRMNLVDNLERAAKQHFAHERELHSHLARMRAGVDCDDATAKEDVGYVSAKAQVEARIGVLAGERISGLPRSQFPDRLHWFRLFRRFP